jgi:hypothetical protein
VTGSVTDNQLVMVEVNASSPRSSARFTAESASADGPLDLVATARDGAGNEGTDSVRVHVDGAPPQIAVAPRLQVW